MSSRVQGSDEFQPFLVADSRRGQHRHQRAVRRSDDLAQPGPILIRQDRDLAGEPDQVR